MTKDLQDYAIRAQEIMNDSELSGELDTGDALDLLRELAQVAPADPDQEESE